MATDQQSLEQQLEELLDVETFDPPEEFAGDGADHRRWHEEAATTRSRTGRSRPRRWTGSSPGTRCSTTPTRRSTSGSPAASSTSPTTAWTATSRPATATAWRSTGTARRARPARRHLRRPAPRRPAVRQRAEGPGRAEGRRRRDLPADDPRGRRGDARVRAHRRVAQRRLRRLQRRVGRASAWSSPTPSCWSRSTARGARARRRRSRRRSTTACPTCRASSSSTRTTTARWPTRTPGTTRSMEAADAECPAEPLDAEHPLFVLYTSGSTAKPKGILHTTGGYLTQVAWTHKHVFDLKPEEDVYWCSADVGWVTGHSYIVYGPLCNGATSVMYEGAPDYPHKGIWWELCERYGVTIFYTAPTAIRACMKWGVEHVEKHDLSKLRLLGTVGEPINPKAWLWYRAGRRRRALPDRRHVVADGDRRDHDHDAARRAVRQARRRPARRCPASTRVLDEEGNEVEPTARRACSRCAGRGRGCCARSTRTTTASSRPTSPSGTRTTYLVGDAAKRDEDGYFWVIGRVDDVINVSGHRMSTAEVESAIVSPPEGRRGGGHRPGRRGHRPVDRRVRDARGRARGPATSSSSEIREHVAERIGKLARPKRIIWADDLPKTRSGKIMRRLLRDIAEGRELGDVTTLRDPDVMAQLETKIKERQARGRGLAASLAHGRARRAWAGCPSWVDADRRRPVKVVGQAGVVADGRAPGRRCRPGTRRRRDLGAGVRGRDAAAGHDGAGRALLGRGRDLLGPIGRSTGSLFTVEIARRSRGRRGPWGRRRAGGARGAGEVRSHRAAARAPSPTASPAGGCGA